MIPVLNDIMNNTYTYIAAHESPLGNSPTGDWKGASPIACAQPSDGCSNCTRGTTWTQKHTNSVHELATAH